MKFRLSVLVSCAAFVGLAAIGRALAEEGRERLQTVAESTDFEATSGFEDVVRFARLLDEESGAIRLEWAGPTGEGRELPVLVIADPPVATPGGSEMDDRLVVLALGAIHAGEVCGKEALLMVARDLARGLEAADLLEKLVIVFVPVLNADGNERVRKGNRPGQVGPAAGMGERANASGLDLNRDFTKLESPEVRALVRLFDLWDPAIVIDTHTTNGSRHGYTLTYDSPRHPGTPPRSSNSRATSFSRRLAGGSRR